MSVTTLGDKTTLSEDPIMYFELSSGMPILSSPFSRLKGKDSTAVLADMIEGKVDEISISGKPYTINKVICYPPVMIKITMDKRL